MRRKVGAMLTTMGAALGRLRSALRVILSLLTGRPLAMSLGGRSLWFVPRTGQVVPALSGAEDDDDEEESDDDAAEDDGDADEDDDEEADADDKDSDDEDDEDSDEEDDVDDDELPDNVKAILKKNRDEARKARKEARDAKRKLREERDSNRPKRPKQKDAGEGGDEPSETEQRATRKLRQANLLTALAAKGYEGAKAKAAARLLDDVEFDDDDEPVDLDDAIEEAADTYGDVFPAVGETPTKKKPRKPEIGSRRGRGRRKGPSLTAAELRHAERDGRKPGLHEALKEVRTVDDYVAAKDKHKDK